MFDRKQQNYANNIVTDQFYIGTDNFPLAKRDYAAQIIDEYDTTVGLYAINIKGNSLPEILQVQLLPNHEYQLDWIISNHLTQTNPPAVTRYTTTLPPQFEPPQISPPPGVPAPTWAPLYRVEVLKSTAGYDQLLLNCHVYDITVSNNQVKLTLAQMICQEPYAGVVPDSASNLMWTRCSIGRQMYDPGCSGMSTDYNSLPVAKSACSDLELSGYTDWRLPSSIEYDTLTPNSAPILELSKLPGVYWIADHNFTRNPVAIGWRGNQVKSSIPEYWAQYGWLDYGQYYRFLFNDSTNLMYGQVDKGFINYNSNYIKSYINVKYVPVTMPSN